MPSRRRPRRGLVVALAIFLVGLTVGYYIGHRVALRLGYVTGRLVEKMR